MGKTTTFIRNNGIAILLAATAILIRLSLLGFHDYPAQATSLDSSYNIAMTEWMADGNYEKMPPYLALGYKDVVQYHPPLLYAAPALISKTLNISPWNAAWLYFAAISGICTLVLFYIGKKMISSEAGMIAAALYVFPLPFIWTYPLYSGMWGLVAGQFFLILEVLLLCIYYEKRSRTAAAALGIAIAMQFLSHFPEAFIFIPFLLCVLLKMPWKREKEIRKDLIMIFCPPLLAFAGYLPKLFNVWLPQVHTGIHLMPEVTSRLESITDIAGNTGLMALGIPIIAFLIAGFHFLIRDKKWYWTGAGAYFIAVPLIAPYFANEAEFFVKMRFFLPLIAYPIAAYGLIKILGHFTLKKRTITAIIAIAILANSLLAFAEINEKRYFPLTKEKYEALKWIEQNTPENATIIYMNGYEGFTSAFAHRTCFEAESGDNGLWCGFFWSEKYDRNYLLPYENSFMEYGYHQGPANASAGQFDYAVYAGKINLDGFEEIYSNREVHISKNCNKQQCSTSSP